MGRPRGSKNKRGSIPPALVEEALLKLAVAVGSGEQWAIQEVLKRVPTALAEPVAGGVQEEVLRARIFELKELEARIQAIENGKGE